MKIGCDPKNREVKFLLNGQPVRFLICPPTDKRVVSWQEAYYIYYE